MMMSGDQNMLIKGVKLIENVRIHSKDKNGKY